MINIGTPITPKVTMPSDYLKRVLKYHPYFYLPLDEPSGVIAVNRTANRMDTQNLLLNPGFETAGAGGADVFGSWSEQVGDGAIARTTVAGEFHSGAAALKHTGGASINGFITQTVSYIVPGNTYRFSFWTKGSGTAAGGYQVRDATNSVNIKARTSTLITQAAWAAFTYEFVAPAGCKAVTLYLYTANINGQSVFYDDVELIGVNNPFTAQYGNGISSFLPTLNQTPGIGDGRPVPYFDAQFVDIYSPALVPYFSGNNLLVSVWAKSDFVWSVADARDVLSLYADGSNQVHLYKSGASTFSWRHIGNGTTKIVSDSSANYSGWQHFALRIKDSTLKAYRNGVQVGTTQTSLGDFNVNLAAYGVKIGNAAQDTNFHSWKGNIAHLALFRANVSESVIPKLARV